MTPRDRPVAADDQHDTGVVAEVPVVPHDRGSRAAPATAGEVSVRPTLGTAIAVAAGLVAAIIVASVAIQIWSDERDDEPDGEPVDDREASPAIVAPDTLPPLPTETSEPARSVATDPLADRPPLELRLLNAGVEPDLAVGVNRLDDTIDQRSATYVENDADGFAMYLGMSRDGQTGRIAADIGTPGLDERVIIDERAGVGYVRRGPSSWETFEATERVVEFWERLLLGPLTSDLLGDASRSTVSDGPVVGIEDPVGAPPTPARAFRVGADAGEFVDWTPFALGPIQGAEAIVPTTPVDLVALVAPDDRLVEVRWSVPFGSATQVVVHRPLASSNVEIAVPAPGEITGPADGWIVLPR